MKTQIIVGFPTETEEEFQETLAFIRECKFDSVDIFGYYEIEGADSAGITPKVDPAVITDRIHRTILHNRRVLGIPHSFS